jgi:pSer/pThr/pTyr-binding forkhead associated (FHA) protein
LPAPVPAAVPTAAALLVARTGQAVAVTAGMSIGRDPGNTLFVDVHDVSRRHATIVTHGAGWAVMDQGSRNGTFVNDQQVLAVTPNLPRRSPALWRHG